MLRLVSFLPKSWSSRAIRLGLTAFLLATLVALSCGAQMVEANLQPGSSNAGNPTLDPLLDNIYVTFGINEGTGFGLFTIDGATNTSTAITSPGFVAVANPVTGYIYIGGYTGGCYTCVTVIDGATQAVVATLDTGNPLSAISVNPATNKIYVLDLSLGDYGPETVTVLDGATNTISTVLTLSSNAATVNPLIATNPATGKTYVGLYASVNNSLQGSLVVIDGATDSVSTVNLGSNEASSLAFNPVTSTIYVQAGNTFFVIDGSTNTATQVVPNLSVLSFAFNPITNKLYAAIQAVDPSYPNQTLSSLAVLDGTNFATLKTIPITHPFPDLGDTTAFSRSNTYINTVTNQVYVGSSTFVDSDDGGGNIGGAVTFVDGVTDSITTVLPLPFSETPENMAVNSMTNKIYLPACDCQPEDDDFYYLYVLGGGFKKKQSIAAGTTPVAVAVNPVTGRIYTADYSGGTVQVTGGSSNTALATVPVTAHPVALAINPVTNRVYVASTGGSTITAIDGETNKATTLAAGSGPFSQFAPQSIAVNTVTNTVYLANFASNNVTVINGGSGSTVATVPTGTGPNAAAVDEATNKIYVANTNNSSVTVIDGATNTTSTVATTGSGPIALAVDAAANKIYVANGSGNSVTVIDGATNATSNVAVGISPYAVGVDPVAHTVYVANYGGKSVTVIDGPTLAATTVATSSEPNAVAVNPVTHMAYVSNITGGSVTAINGAITSSAAVENQGGTTYYTQRLYVPAAPGSSYSYSAPYAIAVNPATDKVYAADKNGGLFIVDVDRNTTVPLKAVATGVTDASTVSTTNVFQTRNSSPSFTVEVTSSFTSTPTYSGVAGAINPPPSAVYYKVDGGSQWSLATMTSAVGANPATFNINLSAQAVGPHTLYFTPVYGNMGATIDGSNTAPETGNLTAYAFQIDPPL